MFEEGAGAEGSLGGGGKARFPASLVLCDENEAGGIQLAQLRVGDADKHIILVEGQQRLGGKGLGRGIGEQGAKKELLCKPVIGHPEHMADPAAAQLLQLLLNGVLDAGFVQVLVADAARVGAAWRRLPGRLAQDLLQLAALQHLEPLQLRCR